MKHISVLLKALFTIVLVYFALKDVDFIAAKKMIYSLNGLAVISVCVLIQVLQSILAGLKVRSVLSRFNYHIDSYQSVSFLFLGNFISQLMVSFIGGDAIRIVGLSRAGVESGVAFKAVLLDRILGFIGVQLLYLGSLPFVLPLIDSVAVQDGLNYLTIGCLVMVVGFIASGSISPELVKNSVFKRLFNIITLSKYALKSKIYFIKIVLLSGFLHFGNILAIYYATNALGASMSLFNAFIIGTPVMLISLLPISVNGWGVRESSMIFGFSLLAISSDIALSVSVILGLASLIASLPGALVLFTKHKEATYFDGVA